MNALPFVALRRRAAVAALAFALAALGCVSPPPDVVSRPAEPPESVLIRDVAVVDVESGERALGRDVLIRAGRIAVIEATGAIDPEGAAIVEGAGASLVPGLIDMHGHLTTGTRPIWDLSRPDPEGNLLAYLFAGVTTIQDPGDLTGDAVARRERVARGELPGPRIYTAGKIVTCPGGHPIAFASLFTPPWIRWYVKRTIADTVESDDEAARVVAAHRSEGVDFVKIAVDRLPPSAPRMPKATIRSIVRHARAADLRVAAHIGRTQDALDTGEAGVSLWLHGVAIERIPDEDISRLAGFGIPMVATMEVVDRYMRGLEGPIVPTRIERETVPADVLGSFYPVPDDFDLDEFGELGEGPSPREMSADNIRRLRAAGVTILAGSDTQSGVFPGAGLHRELAQLVRAGLTPAEAIRAATLDAATYLANGEPLEFGAVRVGLEADLVLVDGDPTSDIARLQDIREVFVDGVAIDRTPITAP